MKAEFWLERWQKSEIGFHQPAGNPYLHRYWSRTASAQARRGRVFVPLCGKSHDLIWLRDRGHQVLGVELALRAVHDFFAENSLAPQTSIDGPFERWQTDGIEILCGDFFALDPARLSDVGLVFDRAALIALPPEMREKYATKLTSLLSPGATILLVTMEYDQSQMSGPPFAVAEPEVRRLYQDAFEIDLLERRDVLAENARFRERGLTHMCETVYLLRAR